MVVTLPFIEVFRGGTLIEAVLTTTLLLSAIFAAGAQGKKLVFGFLLATPALIASWEPYSRPELMSLEIFRGTAIMFFGFVVLQLFWFIVRAPRVDSEVLCAGVTVYLMLGLMWSLPHAGRLAGPEFLRFQREPRCRPPDGRLPSQVLQFHHA